MSGRLARAAPKDADGDSCFAHVLLPSCVGWVNQQSDMRRLWACRGFSLACPGWLCACNNNSEIMQPMSYVRHQALPLPQPKPHSRLCTAAGAQGEAGHR